MNKVVEYLRIHSAPDSPISGRNLANHFGFTPVKVREYVNEARCSGVPICSTRWGYFYSEDTDLISKTVESMRGRIASQERAIAGLSSILCGRAEE